MARTRTNLVMLSLTALLLPFVIGTAVAQEKTTHSFDFWLIEYETETVYFPSKEVYDVEVELQKAADMCLADCIAMKQETTRLTLPIYSNETVNVPTHSSEEASED